MNTLQDCLQRYQEYLREENTEKSAKKKVQKTITVIYQIFFPLIGQSQTSRSRNKALLAQISCHGFIEEYNARIIEKIEELKSVDPKNGANYLSSWKPFIQWLEDQPDYQSELVATTIDEEEGKFRVTAKKGYGLAQTTRKQNPNRKSLKYGVKERELPPHLQEFLQQFRQDLVISAEEEDRLYRQGEMAKKQGKKRKRTIDGDIASILGLIGWLSQYYQSPTTDSPIPVESIQIQHLYNIEILKLYLEWHQTVRGNGNGTLHNICKTAVSVAQYDLKKESYISRHEAHPIIKDLMTLRSQYNPNKGSKPHTSPDAIKKRMLEHHECVRVVEFWEKQAKGLEKEWREEGKYSRRIVEDAWQNYLIITLLTFGAIRQREICEMNFDGRRLYHSEYDGAYWCKLFPSEHKTHGEREYPLFPGSKQQQLTNDFTHYLQKIRPQLPHDFVFFNRGTKKINLRDRGNPINPKTGLTSVVKTAINRATGEILSKKEAKAMTPHDFRRSSSTWFAHYGDPADVFVFAKLHGHSPEMLMKLYAQVRDSEITRRATEVFTKVEAREKHLKQQGNQLDYRKRLKSLIEQISSEQLPMIIAFVEQVVSPSSNGQSLVSNNHLF